ncbi:hypothetical protein PLICRDRAFT_99241 [Plicaturopsis crispa FD-325 SS-3]|nr:hypothetical protein PLICRDRAFT_99241 [Plicaturopsis crispa FD-325 SS-3]
MVHDSPPTGTPSAGQVSAQDDVDQIPSLSLPPPIMPHRVYGHNYLDKSYLIQITIGHSVPHDKASSGRESAVRLHPRLTGTTANDQYLLPSTPLKLVMTSPDANSAPYSIPLPQQEEKGFFSFQISSLDAVSLEFSICPRVGTKTLGRNICIPAAFQGIENSHPFVLPILDNRLHIIGEVSFEVNFVAPFNGVTLEVGGAVETYWKSMMLSHLGPRLGTPTRILSSPPMSGIGSIHTSPSVHSVTGASGQTLTISSLSGDYLYLVVQVTRDLHPVIFSDWVLPETGFDLGVADVSLAQFEDLAKKLGRELCDDSLSSIQDWRTAVRGSMVSLAHLMLVLPVNFGLSLELAYPSQTIVQRLSLGRRLDLNLCVDAFLRTIYHTSSSAGILTTRRRLNFTSFSPDTCAALNWKQPNYPVFFSSHCGLENHGLLGPTAMDLKDDPDRRLFSLSAAVEFAKSNNLLGIFVNTDILVSASILFILRSSSHDACPPGPGPFTDPKRPKCWTIDWSVWVDATCIGRLRRKHPRRFSLQRHSGLQGAFFYITQQLIIQSVATCTIYVKADGRYAM